MPCALNGTIDSICHISAILEALAFLQTDMVKLRALECAALILMVIYTWLKTDGCAWDCRFLWSVFHLFINGGRLYLFFYNYFSLQFSCSEEKRLFEGLFSIFSRAEMKTLQKNYEMKRFTEKTTLATINKPLKSLYLLLSGSVIVENEKGKELHKFSIKEGDPQFIGEVSFYTQGLATATVKVTKAAVALSWDMDKVRKLSALHGGEPMAKAHRQIPALMAKQIAGRTQSLNQEKRKDTQVIKRYQDKLTRRNSIDALVAPAYRPKARRMSLERARRRSATQHGRSPSLVMSEQKALASMKASARVNSERKIQRNFSFGKADCAARSVPNKIPKQRQTSLDIVDIQRYRKGNRPPGVSIQGDRPPGVSMKGIPPFQGCKQTRNPGSALQEIPKFQGSKQMEGPPGMGFADNSEPETMSEYQRSFKPKCYEAPAGATGSATEETEFQNIPEIRLQTSAQPGGKALGDRNGLRKTRSQKPGFLNRAWQNLSPGHSAAKSRSFCLHEDRTAMSSLPSTSVSQSEIQKKSSSSLAHNSSAVTPALEELTLEELTQGMPLTPTRKPTYFLHRLSRVLTSGVAGSGEHRTMEPIMI